MCCFKAPDASGRNAPFATITKTSARILSKYASTSKTFEVKSGYLDKEIISLEKIDSLAKLPSREILLATVCNAFNAPIASFARAIQAIVDKSGEAAPAADTGDFGIIALAFVALSSIAAKKRKDA